MNKGERTKNYIIEQSSSLFNMQGYKTTSISDIMNATGLKKGGIYNHFENKESLAEASFLHSMNTLKEHYIHAVSEKNTAYEQFDEFINVFNTLLHDQIIRGGCPLMNAAIEADDSMIEFEDTIKDGFDGLILLIANIIQYGQVRNEINKDIHPDEMAVFILSSLEGSLALNRLNRDKKYLDMIIKQLKKMLF
ncbi:TetR/AcrR family transcriptional regulator [Bacillus sp. OAE603]|uniref:TetR/AcrR family transcriptional regulator n=1 Tax=Gottfriedia sp. OAE603 TaxID=2663872 RepID=UPI00178BE106